MTDNCDSQSVVKSIRLNGLFYVQWCMPRIKLRWQQEAWILKS